MDNIVVWPLSVENEALLTCNFTSSSFNLFKNVCERSRRLLKPIARKKDLISTYRGARVSGFFEHFGLV